MKFLKYGNHIKKIKLGKKWKYTNFKQLRPKVPKRVLLEDTRWRRWDSNPRSLGLESSTLPLSHCDHIYKNRTCVYWYTQEATTACFMLTIWNHISISINKLLEIHSGPLSKWPLIILYELIFCGNFTYRVRLFPRVYVFVSSAKDWFDFSQMWIIGTQFSQMWWIGTSSSHLWRIEGAYYLGPSNFLRSEILCREHIVALQVLSFLLGLAISDKKKFPIMTGYATWRSYF